MNNRYVIANWKMNLSLTESVQLAKKIKLKLNKEIWKRQVVICPDFLSLNQVSLGLKGSKIKLGAQNCFWEEKGSYTGEVSVKRLKDLPTDMIIVGHSERRNILQEDSVMINKKIKKILSEKLIPILCIGETDEIKSKGKTKSFLKKQLKESLEGVDFKKNNEIILAYEPIWAIGSGKNMPAEEVKEILVYLKSEFAKLYNDKVASEKVIYIYGGSVNSGNVKLLSKYPEIEGVLVGGASLKLSSFINICKSVLK